MKVKVSSVIMFLLVSLMVVVLMLCDAMGVLPYSVESVVDALGWGRIIAMTVAVALALWAWQRYAAARKKAAHAGKNGECNEIKSDG